MDVRVRTVEVGDARLAVRDIGPSAIRGPWPPAARNGRDRAAFGPVGSAAGVPVVVLHGLASSAATWDRFAGHLADQGRRVIAIDQRGHGASSRGGTALGLLADDALRVADHLGLGAMDLVGHSMGGRVATLVAMRAPDRVRRLVLEDTPPPRTDARPDRRGRPIATAARNLFFLSRLRTFDVRMAAPVVREVRAPDPDWWAGLGRITAPTLLVHGGAHGEVPAADLARMAQELPDARIVTIEAGHRVHSHRPDEFIAAVAPFLA